MSTRTQSPRAARPAGAGRPGAGLPTRARVRSQMVIGVLLIVGAALIGALLFLNAGDRVSALAVRDGVPAGQKITRDNLISTSVAGVDGAIAVEDVDQVVGKSAAVGLVDGQVLTDGVINDEQLPRSGQALAGLALTAAQMPGDGLEAGDQVRVIAVPGADASGGDLSEASTVLAPTAIVYSVREATSGEAAKVVTVVVPEAAADQIAVHAAAGRVAVVKTPNLTGGQ